MVKVKGFIRKYVPVFTLVSFALALLSLVFTLIARSSYAFADFINSTVSHAYRFLAAKISGIFPFSLFEVLTVLWLARAFPMWKKYNPRFAVLLFLLPARFHA